MTLVHPSHIFSGTTSLFNGERRSKSDPRFDVLGTVDELNAHLGSGSAGLNSKKLNHGNIFDYC